MFEFGDRVVLVDNSISDAVSFPYDAVGVATGTVVRVPFDAGPHSFIEVFWDKRYHNDMYSPIPNAFGSERHQWNVEARCLNLLEKFKPPSKEERVLKKIKSLYGKNKFTKEKGWAV